MRAWSVLFIGLSAVALTAKPINGQQMAFPPEFEQGMEQMFQRFMGDSDAERQRLEQVEVSPREEQRVGRERLAQFRRDLAQRDIHLVERGKEVDYLQSLINRIRPRLKNANRYRIIEVYLVETTATDAGSLPGGFIVVSRGLLDFCQSEAALVGVLSHELSHLDRGHQLELVRRMKLFQQSMQGRPAGPQSFFADGMVMAKGFARPFRPDQEVEADADATRWTYELNYDPLQMAELFDRLHERDQARDALRMPTMFRSHPYHQDRSRAIRQQTADLQRASPKRDLIVGREELRQLLRER
ncbi:MAG: M48 family metallopeptidase [Planctomycetales bacterium]|nr:M48 family metallopeptidase [Planctomycetales bacterium]